MMMEQTNLVPKRRFREFQDTDAWEQRKLDEEVTFYSGLTYTPADVVRTDGTLVLRSSNVQNNEVVTIDNVYVNSEVVNSDNVEVGDIIVVVRNGSKSLIGKHAQIKGEMPKTVIGAFMTGIRSQSPAFVNALLSTSLFNAEIEKNLGATINQITGGMFKSMTFAFPSEEEQKIIGKFFHNIDHLITLHQRKLDKKKALKSAYLSEMFPAEGESEPKRRFAGFTDAWEQRTLGEVGDTFTGLSGKTKEDFGHGDAQFVTYVNVFGNVISDPNGVENVEIDEKQNQVKYGDVFFTTSSETPEEVGMSSVWLENTENVYLNSFCFGYRPTVEFDLYYLAFMLRSPEIRKKFMFLAQGISRYNISKNKVMEMKVPVPGLNEQHKIGIFFKDLDHLITLHQRKLEKLQNIKKAYLNEMFV